MVTRKRSTGSTRDTDEQVFACPYSAVEDPKSGSMVSYRSASADSLNLGLVVWHGRAHRYARVGDRGSRPVLIAGAAQICVRVDVWTPTGGRRLFTAVVNDEGTTQFQALSRACSIESDGKFGPVFRALLDCLAARDSDDADLSVPTLVNGIGSAFYRLGRLAGRRELANEMNALLTGDDQ